jgi:hypothetical protein
MATTTGVEIGGEKLRRKSLGAIELQTPDGRRRTIQLEDLSEADQKLAAQFGYKPVGSQDLQDIDRGLIYHAKGFANHSISTSRSSRENLATCRLSLSLSVSVGCFRPSPLPSLSPSMLVDLLRPFGVG